jgi:hypothetical protein
LVYRGQWQSESYLFLRNKNIFRQQLSIQPQLKGKKWQPSLDFEWFYRTNQNQYWIADDLIVTGGTREFRYQLNFDYKISDQQKLQIFALYRQFEIAKTNQIVFGIGYHFKINGPR